MNRRKTDRNWECLPSSRTARASAVRPERRSRPLTTSGWYLVPVEPASRKAALKKH